MTGQQLVTAIRQWLGRYVVLSPEQSLTLALWALHTWVYEHLSRSTAYVEVTGVTGSGKTTLMEALSLLSRGPEIFNTLSTKAMCRIVRNTGGACSFFVDEAERLAHSSFGDQRSMLASGYRKGGFHAVTVGEDVIKFPSWCPKMFTSLRTVTPVIHGRCIPVWLERARPTASLSLEWERAEITAGRLVEAFHALMGYKTERFQDGEDRDGLPIMRTTHKVKARFVTLQPDWLQNERNVEIWTPLFSLAATLQLDAATMNELTAASVDLSKLRGIERRMDTIAGGQADAQAAERSAAIRLARDIETVVTGYLADRPGERNIHTADLMTRLQAIPTGGWRGVLGAPGLTDQKLGEVLSAFGVRSNTTVQVGKGRKGRVTAKGYTLADLRRAAGLAKVPDVAPEVRDDLHEAQQARVTPTKAKRV